MKITHGILTTHGLSNGMADEVMDEIERLQRRTVSTAMVELADARKEIERLQKELDGHAFEISRPMLLAKIEQLQEECKVLRFDNVRLTRKEAATEWGHALWDWLREMLPDAGLYVEFDTEELMKLAANYGKAKRVKYDPALHGEMEVETGEEIWWWGDKQ